MKKIILFDIDGTLATPAHRPSAATGEAIRKIRQNGHLAYLSTGRTFDSVPADVAQIGFDGGIFSSGGLVRHQDTVISRHFMQEDLTADTIRFLTEHAVFFILETAEGRINSDNTAAVLARVDMDSVSEKMKRFTYDLMQDSSALPYSTYHGQPVYKISYCSPDPDIAEKLVARFGQSATVVPFVEIPGFPLTLGEISDPAITKGRALTELCRHLEVTPDRCIAFGDSMNDAEIIQTAGLGIAMGNAVPELKALADRICDTCENDGVAKALEELGLL